MRYLVISDIHAHLPAFEAVLADAKGQYDKIWCLGDIVSVGAYPNECIELLMMLNHIAIAGNAEWVVLGKVKDSLMADFRPEVRDDYLETRVKLTVKSREYLENLPTTLIIDDLFTLVHGSPRHPIWEYIWNRTIAQPNFKHFTTPYCLVGHTHEPVSYQAGLNQEALPEVLVPGDEGNSVKFNDPIKLGARRLIINPGGVGGGHRHHNFYHSYYVILDTETHIFTFRRIPLVDNPYVQLFRRRNEYQRSLPNCQPIPPKNPPANPPKEPTNLISPNPPVKPSIPVLWEPVPIYVRPTEKTFKESGLSWLKWLNSILTRGAHPEKTELLVEAQLISSDSNPPRHSYRVVSFRTAHRKYPIATLAVIADSISPFKSSLGKTISETVATTIVETFSQSKSKSVAEVFIEAFKESGQSIIRVADDEMCGAVCAAALIMGNRLYTATIGDSRIYLLRQEQLHQISVDDTLVQYLLDSGKITPRELNNARFNGPGVIRYLGSESDPSPNFRLRLNPTESDQQSEANQGLKLYPGDEILLASRNFGISNTNSLCEILLIYKQPQQAIEKLISMVRQSGYPGSATVVLLKVSTSD